MAKSITLQMPTGTDANFRSFIAKVQALAVDVCLSSAGLAIGTGSKKKVKVVNDTRYTANGVMGLVAAASEVTLAGTITNAKFNVYVISVTSAGVVSAAMGTEGATLGAVVFPTVPADSAVLGFVIVNPTGTGNFVGGTTDLDDGTVVPNAVYVNTPFPFNMNLMTV